MFGGVAFLDRGHMFCGVLGPDLMVRVGPDAYDAALRRRHVREMDLTGRPMRRIVTVARAGVRTRRQLEAWVAAGLAFTRTLPPK